MVRGKDYRKIDGKTLRTIGEEQFQDFIDLAKDNGFPEVAKEIQRILDTNDWDCMTDIPVIVSRAYAKVFGGR